jgi:murein DD-endopeptidase MepM/ murein hydrolase activator NlpD
MSERETGQEYIVASKRFPQVEKELRQGNYRGDLAAFSLEDQKKVCDALVEAAKKRNYPEKVKNLFGTLDWPIPLTNDAVISQGFSDRELPMTFGKKPHEHKAIDIQSFEGTPVYAPMDAIILSINYDQSRSDLRGDQLQKISLGIQLGSDTLVMDIDHLSSETSSFKVGDTIKKGTQLGTVGTFLTKTGQGIYFPYLEAAQKYQDDHHHIHVETTFLENIKLEQLAALDEFDGTILTNLYGNTNNLTDQLATKFYDKTGIELRSGKSYTLDPILFFKDQYQSKSVEKKQGSSSFDNLFKKIKKIFN